jgi:Glycosyltransferase family 87
VRRARAILPLVVGAGCLAGVVLAVLAARRTGVTEHSPVRPPGGWRDAWTYGLIGAFALYVAGLALLRRRATPRAPVLVLAAAIQLAPLAAPLLLSTDAYSYWDYGRVAAVHHGNPYADRPSRFPGDPAYRRMGRDWQHKPSVYGPVFTLGSEGVAHAAGGSPRSATRAFRIAAAVGMVALAALASLWGSFAAAFVGWSPLLALHFAGGGHNDVLMMLFVLGALAAARAFRPGWAGAAWVAALSIKITALVFLPLRAVEAYRRGRRVSHWSFAAAALVVAAVASAHYGPHWLAVLSPVANQLHSTSSLGLPYWADKLGLPERRVTEALIAAYALFYLWLLREAWRGRARLGLAACGLLLATSWLQPWYAVWAVPLAAVEEDALARLAALALSAYFLRDALPL